MEAAERCPMDGGYNVSEGVPHLVCYCNPFQVIVAYVNRISLAKVTTTNILVSRMARLEGNIGKYAGAGRIRGPKSGVTADEGRQQFTRSGRDRRPYFSVSSREAEEYGHRFRGDRKQE